MEKREHIILGMIWQVLKVYYFIYIRILENNVFLGNTRIESQFEKPSQYDQIEEGQ